MTNSQSPDNSTENTQETQPVLLLPSLGKLDGLIAAGLGLLVFLCLACELTAPGVTWDEGLVQFPVARNQAFWIRNLFSLQAPFSQKTIDQYWYTKSDHPSPPRTAAALSYLLLNGWVDEIAAFRLPSAIVFSTLVGSIYLFLRLFLPKAASLAGASSLALMPCVFGHAHIFSLDLPIMAWWFWAAAAGFLVFHGKIRPVWFGLCFATAFSVKLHAVFLPVPLLIWIGCMLWFLHGWERSYWMRSLWASLWAILFTPIFYIGSQPWLWHETIQRIISRFFHYIAKTPIPVYYLGAIYGERNPWHYPFVMALYTIPAVILLFVVLGLLSPLEWKRNSADAQSKAWFLGPMGVILFLVLLFLAPMGIVQFSKAYDGCRLILPCFPFAACLAGFGYHLAWTTLKKRIPTQIAHALLLAFLFVPSLYAYAKIRPFYLSYYNELAGGVSGAWKKGMETAFWCDALTRDFMESINRIVPEGKTVKPASMSFEVYEYYRNRGWLKPPIADPADYYLLQSRQGMWRREEMYLFFREKPLAAVEVDGVQLFGLYKTPTP